MEIKKGVICDMKRSRRTLMMGILLLYIMLVSGNVLAQRPMVVGANGMVSSIDPMAAEAGLEILRQGGNALDAFSAISATLAVTLFEYNHLRRHGGLSCITP